jgi:NTP pyrophosphatase (non-canonical NTP hydrolase)
MTAEERARELVHAATKRAKARGSCRPVCAVPWGGNTCAIECDEMAAALLAFAAEQVQTERERVGLRKEVMRFAVLMENVLRANDHKGGWSECDSKWLLERLREEVRELSEAVEERLAYARSNARSIEDAPRIWLNLGREAADVANFAMMIADVCGELPKVKDAINARGK